MNFKDREQRIKKKLSSDEAILVNSREAVFYLSGFSGSLGFLIISKKKSILLVDGRYFEKARKEAVSDEIFLLTDFIEDIKKILDLLKVKRCYFDGESLSYRLYERISKKLETVNLVDGAGEWIKNLRAVKDHQELKIIAEGALLSKKAFTLFKRQVKILGMKERECVNELEYRLKKFGDNISFDTLVLAGENSSLPHGQPSNRIIGKKDSVIIDFGLKYKNYCTDNTRTLIFDNPLMERYLRIVKKAFKAGLGQISDGREIKLADIAVRDVFEKEGLLNNFLHSSGHGIGLSVHEYPTLSYKTEGIFKEGMVVTLEPGLYFEGIGGVRYEEMILVTKKSCEIL